MSAKYYSNNIAIILIVLSMTIINGCARGKEFIDSLELPTFGDQFVDEELEFPPDLDAVPRKSTYDISGSKASMKAARQFAYVLPERMDMQLVREGNIAWLAVGESPVNLWQHIERFWKNYGFSIIKSNPTNGSLVTNWRERKLDRDYDGRMQDQFRTRLERDANGITNIYIVNRKSIFTDEQLDVELSDIETEIDVLYDLRDYLVSLQKNTGTLNLSELERLHFTLDIQNMAGIPALVIGHSYSHVWRVIGSVLSRIGIEVLYSDRSQGTYLIQSQHQKTSLQIHLLARKNSTVITVHPENDDKISYATAHKILNKLLMAY